MNAAAEEIQPDYTLRRPLNGGEPIVYWRLGETAEARYDVADQPMKGEMDPFFFLTKHKNFIPHEYPCRTQFAAERRGKRPSISAGTAMTRMWLPFASPRVDLSGFWFRPTIISTVAETAIEAASAGEARLRLRTCGGAILSVNGQESGWMAPYGRNLETAEEFTVFLNAGANKIQVQFDDLAERDARYYFQLDYLSGPSISHALPISVDGSIADAIEGALEVMHFEKPAYASGEVALVTRVGLPVDMSVAITIEGDFMSIEPPVLIERRLAAGDTRIALGDTADLPADFRHFTVELKADGFAASRVFGVELCHAERQGQAPSGLSERISEALGEVAHHAEGDTVCALARLGIGLEGAATEAMIEDALPAIEDCHDCADFILVPLLWSRAAYGDLLSAALRDRIDRAILTYRYWMDESGNDVQWYFSENHALLFHTAAYVAGHLLPEEVFVRSGRKGSEQSETGEARVRAWLDHFEEWEMAEFNSAPYFPIDLKGLCALYAFAPDVDIRERAGRAILRLLEVVARSAHHGILTGAQGRSYEHTLRASRTLELSGIARMLWGKGNYGKRFHALPQLALCLRDHGLEVPDSLVVIASAAPGTEMEWMFAQGQDRFAKLYHFKTAGYAMGTAAGYRWHEWGYQETVLQVRLGENPNAQLWINHPGEVLQSGYGRPSYWGGSGTLPRVHQYKGLAVAVFDCHEEQPDFTHAWFPVIEFDEVQVRESRALARADDGMMLVATDGPMFMAATGPTAGNELQSPGRQRVWIVRLGEGREHGDLDAFEERFSGLTVEAGADGTLMVEDPEYGFVRFLPDARVEAEGRELDPSGWMVRGEVA